ncbi:MAG TPA: TonB family protein [Burkholderiales bacterium]|nr:TonB family protein [Burkholderiales bacterium]
MTLSLANLGGPGAGGASSPLAWAVTASIALHVALIAGLPELWDYSPAPATTLLNARLEPGMPASSADVAPAAEPAKQPHLPAERMTAPRPTKAALPAARPDRARRDVTEIIEPAAPAAPLEQAAVAPAAGTGGSVSGEPTLAPRPGDDALDLGSLAQYRLALIGAAKRHRLYPEHAIERGWQGRVTVRLAFGADGAIAAALVHRSSGHGSLDRQAVEMLRKAAALTPLPPALRSREFSVEVPVLFELRGAG